MKNITPLQDKLGHLDPMDVLSHVANGGSLDDLAKSIEVRYSDLWKYIISIPDGEKKYDLAIKAAEARDRDLVVRSLRGIIETYPTDMFEDDGSLKPVSDWPKELLAGFEIEELAGKVEGTIKKIKTVDRLKAMEMLGKERGMFVSKVKLDTTLTLEQIVEQSHIKKAEVVNDRQESTDGLHDSSGIVSEPTLSDGRG